jgi:hypothetical protein
MAPAHQYGRAERRGCDPGVRQAPNGAPIVLRSPNFIDPDRHAWSYFIMRGRPFAIDVGLLGRSLGSINDG